MIREHLLPLLSNPRDVALAKSQLKRVFIFHKLEDKLNILRKLHKKVFTKYNLVQIHGQVANWKLQSH